MNGQFNHTHALGIDDSGFVYVADRYNNRVQKFTSAGVYSDQWGGPYGSGDGQFNEPHGIAINSSRFVFVTDSYNYRVQIFTEDGKMQINRGSYGSEGGQFADPHGIAIDNNDDVYATEFNNNRIQKFSSSPATVIRPVTSFTVNSTSGSAPLTVRFTDMSSNTPTTWNWSFRNVTGNNTLVVFSTVRESHKCVRHRKLFYRAECQQWCRV